MSRKKKLLTTLFAIICLISIFTLAYNLTVQSTPTETTGPENETPLNSKPLERDDLFVAPESPLGTLGLVSTSAIAFGLYALKKRRK
jgi:hypothetical protein